MTDEFRANLSIEMPDGWDKDRLWDMLLACVGVRGGGMGGSIRPEPVQEQEFYESLRDEFQEIIFDHLGDYLRTQAWAKEIAQDLVDHLTKDALI